MLFLFEQRQGRLGRAVVVSAVTHVAVFLLALIGASYLPDIARTVWAPEPPSRSIVWLSSPGPGGGGGGGGNESPEPPRKAELPGREKLAIPVAKPPKIEDPKPDPPDDPKPEQALVIPAKALEAGEQTLPGVLEAISVSNLSQGPGRNGGAGTGSGVGIGSGQGPGLGPGYGGGTGGGAFRAGSGIESPVLVREVKPQYTSDAMRAKVQGEVWLEAVVLPDGTVGRVEIIRSLDPTFGLDQEAVKAARQWKFIPGTRMGQPVPVIVTIQLTFTLR